MWPVPLLDANHDILCLCGHGPPVARGQRAVVGGDRAKSWKRQFAARGRIASPAASISGQRSKQIHAPELDLNRIVIQATQGRIATASIKRSPGVVQVLTASELVGCIALVKQRLLRLEGFPLHSSADVDVRRGQARARASDAPGQHEPMALEQGGCVVRSRLQLLLEASEVPIELVVREEGHGHSRGGGEEGGNVARA